jgi:hypothetical protein
MDRTRNAITIRFDMKVWTIIPMMMIKPMERYFVSELQAPTSSLFIPQVIHEHREPWWNDIDKGKLVIRPPQLSGNSTSRII